MKINNKITKALIVLVGAGGLLATSPIYAGYYHHHYYHHHHGGANLAAGLFFGAALGMIAGAAISHSNDGYYDSCRRVSYRRYCREDFWGDEHCYAVKQVAYVC